MPIHPPRTLAEFIFAVDLINMELDYWYSYVSQGLTNQIQGHSRKDQRTYQRKFNSWLARRDAFKSSYPEFLI